MIVKKLKKKFILVIMLIVSTIVLSVIIGVFVSTKSALERDAFVSLASVVRETGSRTSDKSLSRTPILIASVDESGSVEVLNNRTYYTDDDTVDALVQLALSDGTEQGKLESYSLIYMLRVQPDGSEIVAFADTSMIHSALLRFATNSLMVLAGALLLFFIVSLFLARWITNPVEQALSQQRRFVADASHELKTPLAVICSNIRMMIDSESISDRKNLQRLDNIDAESNRMKTLIEDLLTLAHSDSGCAACGHSQVSLSYIVTRSILTMEPVIFESGRQLEYKISPDILINGDAESLRRLTDILLDNARKYSVDGSTISVSLEACGKNDACLSVGSEGIPIPQEKLEHIFRRFYRLDESRQGAGSYGLGLSIAQSIVKEHGGRIWAQSDGKSNNTFYVRLPALKTGS